MNSATLEPELEMVEAGIQLLIDFVLQLKRWDKALNESTPVKTPTQSHREAVKDGTKC